MTGLVTILSGRGAHIKKGYNYQFYFASDFKKTGRAQNEKGASVQKRGVNSCVHFVSNYAKMG